MEYMNTNSFALGNFAPVRDLQDDRFLDSFEECMRYTGPSTFGTYYPVPILPGRYYNDNMKWPIVMAPGTVVSVISLRAAIEYNEYNFPAGYDRATGITSDGKLFVVRGVDGTFRKSTLDHLFHKGTSGFIVPANGGVSVSDSYADKDGDYGMLVPTGLNTATVASSASTAYVRTPNRPFGIVQTAVYAYNEYRYMNYKVHQNGYGILRDGVMTVPYVLVFGTNSSNVTTVASAIYARIDKRLQFFMASVSNTTSFELARDAADYLMSNKTPVMSDENGHLKPFVATTPVTGNATPGYQIVAPNAGDSIDFPTTGACGLSAGTYNIRVTVDGGTVQAISVVTVANTTFAEIAAQIDAALIGASFILEDGHFVCTSQTQGTTSSILVQDGASAGLLAAITALSDPDYTATIVAAVAGTNPANNTLSAAEIDAQLFGKIHQLRTRQPYHLDEIIDTPENTGIAGTDTAGLQRRLAIFIQNVLGTSGVMANQTYTREDYTRVVAAPIQTVTAGVYVKVGMVDIGFGTMM